MDYEALREHIKDALEEVYPWIDPADDPAEELTAATFTAVKRYLEEVDGFVPEDQE